MRNGIKQRISAFVRRANNHLRFSFVIIVVTSNYSLLMERKIHLHGMSKSSGQYRNCVKNEDLQEKDELLNIVIFFLLYHYRHKPKRWYQSFQTKKSVQVTKDCCLLPNLNNSYATKTPRHKVLIEWGLKQQIKG